MICSFFIWSEAKIYKLTEKFWLFVFKILWLTMNLNSYQANQWIKLLVDLFNDYQYNFFNWFSLVIVITINIRYLMNIKWIFTTILVNLLTLYCINTGNYNKVKCLLVIFERGGSLWLSLLSGLWLILSFLQVLLLVLVSVTASLSMSHKIL